MSVVCDRAKYKSVQVRSRGRLVDGATWAVEKARKLDGSVVYLAVVYIVYDCGHLSVWEKGEEFSTVAEAKAVILTLQVDRLVGLVGAALN